MSDAQQDSRNRARHSQAPSADDDLPATRTRRQTIFYEPLVPQEKQAFQIPQGRGTRLRDIAAIATAISQSPADDPVLISIHRILFKRNGIKTSRKRDVGKFSGFDFGDNKEAENIKLRERIRQTNKVKKFVDFFCLPVKSGTEKMLDVIVEFLNKPEDNSANPEPVRPPKKEKKETPKRKRVTKLVVSKKRKAQQSATTKNDSSPKKSAKRTKKNANTAETEKESDPADVTSGSGNKGRRATRVIQKGKRKGSA